VDPMPSKTVPCRVVSDTVTVTLRRQKSAGGRGSLFVRCSEKDCLYIDANRPPCPLTVSLFGAEIRARRVDRA
jgi:hypothetical protein